MADKLGQCKNLLQQFAVPFVKKYYFMHLLHKLLFFCKMCRYFYNIIKKLSYIHIVLLLSVLQNNVLEYLCCQRSRQNTKIIANLVGFLL
jgi:hypothetical protein